MDHPDYKMIIFSKRPNCFQQAEDQEKVKFFFNYIERCFIDVTLNDERTEVIVGLYELDTNVVETNITGWLSEICHNSWENVYGDVIYLTVDRTGLKVTGAYGLTGVIPTELEDITPDEDITHVKFNVHFAVMNQDQSDAIEMAQRYIDDMQKDRLDFSDLSTIKLSDIATINPLIRRKNPVNPDNFNYPPKLGQ